MNQWQTSWLSSIAEPGHRYGHRQKTTTHAYPDVAHSLFQPPALAGKGDEEFMPAIGVGAAHPGESLVQIAASQVFLAHFVHNRPKEAVLLLAILIIAGLEGGIVLVQDLPQGGIGGLPGVIDGREGRHWRSIARHSDSRLTGRRHRCTSGMEGGCFPLALQAAGLGQHRALQWAGWVCKGCPVSTKDR